LAKSTASAAEKLPISKGGLPISIGGISIRRRAAADVPAWANQHL
jgi:hypothetical protein